MRYNEGYSLADIAPWSEYSQSHEGGAIVGTTEEFYYVESVGPTTPQLNCVCLRTGEQRTLFASDVRWVWRAIT
jgi:hypothetical protein